MVPSAADIYANRLSYKGYGVPLWMPEPSKFGEVQIGDVGYVKKGGFYRIFNATLPADNPINKGGVPKGFEVLVTNLNHLHHKEEYLNPGPLCSHSVQNIELGASASVSNACDASYQFKCKESCGAVLFLRDHAFLDDTHEDLTLKGYIKKHHSNWHALTKELGLSIKREEIILVSGCVKTTNSWAVAAFLGRESEREVALQVDIEPYSKIGLHARAHERLSPFVEYRIGKVASPDKDPTADSRKAPARDHCVFVQGFKAKSRYGIGFKIVAAADHNRDQRPFPPDSDLSTSFADQDSDSDGCSTDSEELSSVSLIRDPLENILDYILKNSTADLAIASHSHIAGHILSQITQEDDWGRIPTFPEIFPRITVTQDKVGELSIVTSNMTEVDNSLPSAIPSDCTEAVPSLERIVRQRRRGRTILTTHSFKSNGAMGIGLSEILENPLVRMDHSHDRLCMSNSQGLKITYHIKWPGYPSFKGEKYPLQVTGGIRTKNSISRLQMAVQVAEVMKDFIEMMAPLSSCDPSWKVGPGYINFSDIYLLAIHPLPNAQVQPEFAYRPNKCHDSKEVVEDDTEMADVDTEVDEDDTEVDEDDTEVDEDDTEVDEDDTEAFEDDYEIEEPTCTSCGSIPYYDRFRAEVDVQQGFSASLSDIKLALSHLAVLVPPEIARQILLYAGYFKVVSSELAAPRLIESARCPILSAPKLDPKQRHGLTCVSLAIYSHDQGWCDGDGREDSNSSSWFSLEECDAEEMYMRLVTNVCAEPAVKRHSFEWYRGDKVVEDVRNGKPVSLWACAQYPCWQNHVLYAKWSAHIMAV